MSPARITSPGNRLVISLLCSLHKNPQGLKNVPGHEFTLRLNVARVSGLRLSLCQSRHESDRAGEGQASIRKERFVQTRLPRSWTRARRGQNGLQECALWLQPMQFLDALGGANRRRNHFNFPFYLSGSFGMPLRFERTTALKAVM